MQKKITAAVLCLVAVLVCGAAFAQTLKVGIDPQYPPYSYVDEHGDYAGFDIDMCKSVCGVLGWKPVFIPINWDTKLMSLSSGDIDCIWSGLSEIDSMKDGYTLSKPYNNNQVVILTTANSGIKKLSDLTGKRVGVMQGTPSDLAFQGALSNMASKFAGRAPVMFEDYNTCFVELKAGSIDAIAIDLPVAKAKMRSYGGDFVILDEPLFSEHYVIAFRKNDAGLCRSIEDAYMKCVKDGTYARTADRYGIDRFQLCLLYDGGQGMSGQTAAVPGSAAIEDDNNMVDMSFGTMVMKIWEGLGRTFAIFILTALFSLPLGVLFAAARRSRNIILRNVMRFIISVLRGTPLMLQLIAVTYGPVYLFGAGVAREKLVPIIIAFSVNYGVYFAEIFRGGIDSIPRGQYEAAQVLGYSRVQTFIRIIMPQVMKNVMPSVTNEMVTLVKDTSFAFTVAYQEMFSIGKQLANSQSSFVPFLVAGVFYFAFNALVSLIMGKIEKKMDYYR